MTAPRPSAGNTPRGSQELEERRLDLPLPRNLGFEPPLRGASVRALLFDGERVEGSLLGYDASTGEILVDPDGSAPRRLLAAEVRIVQFRPFEIPSGQRDALATLRPAAMPIEFRDRRRVELAPVESQSDQIGLHLHLIKDAMARRLFIPHAAMLSPTGTLELLPEDSTAVGALEDQAQVAELGNHRTGHVGQPLPARDHVTLAARLGLPIADLLGRDCDRALLDEIPATIARRHRMLPLGLVDGHLRVAMSAPTDTESLQLLQFLTGRSLLVEVANEADLSRAIDESYEFLDEDHDFEALAASSPKPPDGLESQELQSLSAAKPVVRLVNNMLLEAVRRNASDVHIRPGERDVELLFRVDGDLVPVRRFPHGLLRAIVGRIKVIGQMDLTEHRLPQDGQARLRDHSTDLRISVLPSIEGESVVIRLLRATVGMKDLSDLGLTARDTQKLRDALDHQHGMLLVTGPTGSGKSTTLYAALKTVIQRNVNIITLENPVEFHIPGIVQLPINSDIGMTFAAALRNVLRHDPDVVMVGEIRDQETARIAVESALTGHLLLSTLHTNSAVSAVTRLIEMGVESYLVRATLIGVLAQRLVKRICPDCRVIDEEPHAHVRELLGVDATEVFYRGKGCPACGGSGVRGRCITYEYLEFNQALRNLIVPDIDETALQRQAVSGGMTPLTEHALSLARNGTITLLEAYRTRLE